MNHQKKDQKSLKSGGSPNEMAKKAIQEHQKKMKTDPQYKKENEAREKSLKEFFYNEVEEE